MVFMAALSAVNLALYRFTEGLDDVQASQASLAAGFTADALAGNDIISGETDTDTAVSISGSFYTSGGADSIVGWRKIVDGVYKSDIGIGLIGTLRTGAGGDSLTSISVSGIYNGGNVYMGLGNDSITCVAGAISGRGNFYMGQGADIVYALCGLPTAFRQTSSEVTSFFGGAGKDRMVLKDGSYVLSSSDSRTSYSLTSLATDSKLEGVWNLTGFEMFGTPSSETAISDIPLGRFMVVNGEVLLPVTGSLG